MTLTLWIVLGAMTVVALSLVLLPLVRPSAKAPPRSAYELEIYRDQVVEIEREVARGLLSADQAEAARVEIGRRALAAAEGARTTAQAPTTPRLRWRSAVAGVLACGLAAGLYVAVGSPHLADPAASAPDMAGLVARLQARMEQNPDDPRGWALLGQSLVGLRRFTEAAEAYGRAVALVPDDADLLSRYGEALTFAANGVVTPKAQGAFGAAIEINPDGPRARYYLGVADYQAGRTRQALDRWRALEADSPPDAPWLTLLRPRMETLAKQLGEDPPEPSAAPRGPTAEDVRNAQSMSQEDRLAMIRSMVDGLAARLESEPDDFDGWMRLGRSYAVLDEHAKSRDAYARAAALRPDSAAALSRRASAIVEAAGGDVGADPDLPEVLDRLLRHDPDNPVGLWLAGAVAKEDGHPEEARRHWSRLVEQLPPGSPRRAELQQWITALENAQTK